MRFKTLVLFGLLLGFSFQVSAQKELETGLDIGLRGSFIGDQGFGFTMPNAMISESDPFSIYQSNGFQLGIDATYFFDERWGLAAGVNAGNRWIRSSLENPKVDRINSYKNGARMGFLEVPLAFVYRRAICDNGLVMSTRLGPTISFWNGAEYRGGGFLGSAPIEADGDTSESFTHSSTTVEAKAPVLGLLLGIQLEKDIGKAGKLAFGASYHSQLANGLRWETAYYTGSEKGLSKGRFSSSFLSFDIAYYLPSHLFGT